MKRSNRIISMGLIAAMGLSMTACSSSDGNTSSSGVSVPAINEITLGEDYQDITADVKILTNRTDIVDTVYAGYAEEFEKLYPNINVTYEAVTDYEQSLTLRLSTGDWGDICFIPTSVDKSEMSNYFISLGDTQELSEIYNYTAEKTYDGEQYGIANGGTAGGIVYNKKVWAEAGITETPTTPEEFLEDLTVIKENTDAIPLYTNFSDGWPMGQWDSYIGITATGDADFMNNTILHAQNPFSKNEEMTGPYAVYYVLYNAVANGLVEDDPASTDWESSKNRINKGEISSMVLGSWAVQQCKDAGDNPDDIGYMPFPITVDGQQYAGSGGNYSYGINNKISEEQQIASMLYVKWLLEESTIFTDEGSIPALKSADFPSSLEDFEGVELLSDNPALDGEESLFNELNSESELGINNDDYPDSAILEAALYGTKDFDTIMNEWNQKWSAAQESLGVVVNK